MTHSSDERGAEMRELFFETSQELLQALNDEALKLETSPGDVELVRSIRRVVHTFKGDAAACGFRELSNTAHELEDALALESLSSHGRLAEVAFAAADTFGAMLAAYRENAPLPSTAPLTNLVHELMDLAKAQQSGAPQSGAKSTLGKFSKESDPAEPGASDLRHGWTEYENLAVVHAQSRGLSVYQIKAGIDPHC